MAIYKRTPGGPWWTRFTVRGRAIRRSTGTADRELAEEYETALRARYWREVHLGECVHTWREAVARLKRERAWRPATRGTNERALEHFDRLGSVAVAAITGDVALAARQHLERAGLSPGSVNRYMAVFRGVLLACVKWGWLAHAPHVPMAHLPEKDPVWLTPEQCEKLIAQLPAHTRAPALFCALTGMRMGNARDLTWGRVDLERAHCWIPSSHYKTRRAIGLPLSTEVVQLLSSLPRGGPDDPVFTYEGAAIRGTFNTKAFRAARKRAGLTCRWHDLRHTFASWLAVGGASDRVLQHLGGWSSPKMASRYAHLRSTELHSWASVVGTNAVTSLISAMDKDAPKRMKRLVPEIGIEPTTPSLRRTGTRKKA